MGLCAAIESFRFQDATRTIDWQSRTFKEYLSLSFKVVLVCGGLKMQLAFSRRNNDIVVGVVSVASDE